MNLIRFAVVNELDVRVHHLFLIGQRVILVLDGKAATPIYCTVLLRVSFTLLHQGTIRIHFTWQELSHSDVVILDEDLGPILVHQVIGLRVVAEGIQGQVEVRIDNRLVFSPETAAQFLTCVRYIPLADCNTGVHLKRRGYGTIYYH